MASTDAGIYSLNAGEVSRLALARVDLAKMKMACERQANFLPNVLGPAMMRPGTQYIVGGPSDAVGWFGEFYVDETRKTLFVLTAAGMRFLVSDAYVSRAAVTAAVTNGNFDANLTGWTNADEAGATSAWAAGGYMSLIGTGTNFAFRDQQVMVTETNVEHGLRVVVNHGKVSLKVGATAGASGYLDVTLLPGQYSLAFTPTGNFWIRLGASSDGWPSLVDSIQVEAAGAISLPTPWTGTTDFDKIRYDQSEDVVFVASGYQQRRIESRASNLRSWGVALYLTDDGPFRLSNIDESIGITPSQVVGVATLTATRDLFKSGHVGALFRLTHSGQTQNKTLGGANQFSDPIRISGVGASRAFSISVSGTFTATVTLQRSLAAPGSWTDVESYTTETSKSFSDGLDNQIIYYRLGIKTGNYTSGSAIATLSWGSSVQTGVCRITAVATSVSATADILSQFGATDATTDWAEGEWSDQRGWPAAVALHDGRLFWEQGIKTQGSVSDAFASFDDSVIGDSGPINRTVVTGGRDGGRWLLSMQRLLVGTATQEVSIRSSAFDEPLTPTAFVARPCSTRGSAKLRALKVDATGIFVSRNAKRIFMLLFEVQAGDYRSQELTRLKQEICDAGVKDIAVQRQPDTRLWFVLGDGTCAVLTYDQDDEVIAWTPLEMTNGLIERVASLPGTDEDDVYFYVKRTIGGLTKRYVEKLTKRNECQGGTLSKTIDSHIVYTGAAVTTITGLSHLEGQSVVVWGDGAARVTADAPKIVTAGQITGLPDAVANAVVGLPYTAQLKTVKLAYAAEHGSALAMPKRLSRLGMVMADVSWRGVRVGRDFTNMNGLPATYKGKPLTTNQVLAAWDDVPGSFNGGWDSDSRACIQVQSPHCATIMGLVLQMETNEPNPPERQTREQG